MITCKKCQAINPNEVEICQNCGADLLPGESFKDRLGIFLIGIFGGAVSLGILIFLMNNPELTETSQCCIFTNPYAWFLGILGLPITGILNAVRKTPIYKRYENRAKRHIEADPDQAIEDFSKAIDLAPEKQKASLVKQRSELYKKLGREEDFLKDRLTYMESEGAYEGKAALAQTFKADSESFVSSARESERKQLVAEGKIKGVGFCRECQHAVELNEKLRCPLHPKKKPIEVKYVLPNDLESAILEVGEKGLKSYKKTKRTRLIILIILAIFLVLCVVIPLMMNYLPDLFGI